METRDTGDSTQHEDATECPVVPSSPGARRVFGRMRCKIIVSGDFDDPLPDELLAAFYDGPVFPDR